MAITSVSSSGRTDLAPMHGKEQVEMNARTSILSRRAAWIRGAATLVAVAVLSLGILPGTVAAQSNRVLVDGQPPLTEDMVHKTVYLFEWLMNGGEAFSREGRGQLAAAAIHAWHSQNAEGIQTVLLSNWMYEIAAALEPSEREMVRQAILGQLSADEIPSRGTSSATASSGTTPSRSNPSTYDKAANKAMVDNVLEMQRRTGAMRNCNMTAFCTWGP